MPRKDDDGWLGGGWEESGQVRLCRIGKKGMFDVWAGLGLEWVDWEGRLVCACLACSKVCLAGTTQTERTNTIHLRGPRGGPDKIFTDTKIGIRALSP